MSTGTTAKPRKPATRRVDLGKSKTIADVGGLHQKLLSLLERPAPVLLDGSKLERVDTATLQLLVAFERSARAAHVEVSWKPPSEALQGASRLTGLVGHLRLGDND